MKKFQILFVIALITLVSCGGSSSTSSSETEETTFEFYDNTESVMPKITGDAVASISGLQRAADWTSGNNLYEVYQLIREYTYPDDEGYIDGSNMHKSMHDAETSVEHAIEQCAGTTNEDGSVTPSDNLITTQAIDPVYDFGADALAQTYDCAFTTTETGTPASGGEVTYTNSMAVRQSGTAYYLNLGLYMESDTANSPYAMQVEYDTEGGTITVNLAYLVNYLTGEKYSVRLYVDGDISTHLFSLKLLKGGLSLTDEESYISIAGYGYAEGEGTYYLFKLTTSGVGDADGKYFCFESNTTAEEMQAMNDVGSDTVPTTCADLEAGLPDNFAADDTDVPMTTDAFTGTGDANTELTWTE